MNEWRVNKTIFLAVKLLAPFSYRNLCNKAGLQCGKQESALPFVEKVDNK